MKKINTVSCFKFLLLSAVASCSIILTSCGGGSSGGSANANPNPNPNPPPRTSLTATLADPQNGAVNVSDDKTLTLSFNEAVESASVSKDAICLSAGDSQIACSLVNIIVQDGNTIVKIQPKTKLLHGVKYALFLGKSIKAANGDTFKDDYKFNFTTVGESTPPVITAINPQDGATNADTLPFITIAFDHEMKVDTVKSAFSLQKNGDTSTIDMSESVVVSDNHK